MAEQDDTDEIADPNVVTSLDALAHELTLLRLQAAGSPAIRRIAKAIGRPHSTVGDAFTGNRGMPSFDTVAALVRQLDSTADVDAWRRAWLRAVKDQRRIPSRPSPSRRPTAATGRAGVPAAARIPVVNVETGVSIIAAAPTDDVIDVLVAMAPGPAARRLQRVPTPRVVEVLTAMDETSAAQLLNTMDSAEAAAALDEMGTEQAAYLLSVMAADRVADRVVERLSRMRPARAAEAVLQIPGWRNFLKQKLDTFGRVRILEAIADGPLSMYLRSLGNAAPENLLELLQNAPPHLFDRLVTLAPARTVADLLSTADAARATRIVAALSPDSLADVVPHMPQANAHCATPFMAALGEQRLVSLVAQLPVRTATEWVHALNGAISTAVAAHLLEAAMADH